MSIRRKIDFQLDETQLHDDLYLRIKIREIAQFVAHPDVHFILGFLTAQAAAKRVAHP